MKPPPRRKSSISGRRVQYGLRIGEILVRNGALTNDDISKALAVQKEEGGMLGDILVGHGFIDKRVFAKTLAECLGLEFVDLDKPHAFRIDAVQFIPESVANRYKLVGIEFIDVNGASRIKVGMSDPTDFNALDSVRMATGLEPVAAICCNDQILSVLSTAYVHEEVTLDDMAGRRDDFWLESTSSERKESDSSLTDQESGAVPVIKYVNTMLREAARRKVSDVHVEPMERGVRVRFRIDGELVAYRPPPKSLQKAIVSRIKILSGMDIAESRLPQDGRMRMRFLGRDIDMRLSSARIAQGEKIVLRLLDRGTEQMTLEDIGFDDAIISKVRKIIKTPHGIFLVCGPTGSGKSSTLYSFLSELNHINVNIVTVEDPVEYQLEGINQMPVQHTIGLTFTKALRTMLRQDPDIIMVGEIRDLETLETAIRASLTGHLVFSTIHTNTAVGAVTRMADMGLPRYLVSATLLGALSQRLVRRVCQNCKQEMIPDESLTRQLKQLLSAEPPKKLVVPKGCDSCNRTGYSGRVAIGELFTPNDAIRQAISGGSDQLALSRLAKAAGMKVIGENSLGLLERGLTTADEVLSLSMHLFDDDTANITAEGRWTRKVQKPSDDF
ncbi:MAG: Flp pilus assembly complex ATPase component TadA [Planctomycetes bacterium]|nr:Flp pilus assembly complex ATPase component TadA [Planctomycetota bacterium]